MCSKQKTEKPSAETPNLKKKKKKKLPKQKHPQFFSRVSPAAGARDRGSAMDLKALIGFHH